MLSASAYSFRQKSRLAISLSWIAGYTNVIAFILTGGLVISHVTGNVTHFGNALADRVQRHTTLWGPVELYGFLILSFLLGAVSSAFMTEGARRQGLRSKYVLPMAVEALLLVMLSIGVDFDPHTHGRWLAGVAAFAMGLQNATITKISGAVIRTTHLTGVVTDLGLEGAQYLLWVWDKFRSSRSTARGERLARVWRVSQRHPTVLRIALLASIFGSFLFGVVAGALVIAHWPKQALLAPVFFLLWIIWVDYRKPIADVRELDPSADPDFAGYSSIKAFLPAEIGLYRLVHHRKNTPHHAPDFSLWVERLPKHWRVVILAVSPMTHFDPDSVLDLSAAVQRLRAEHRNLVICGVKPVQFKVLYKGGITETLGLENFAPDLEMAIARAMNLLQDWESEDDEVVPPG